MTDEEDDVSVLNIVKQYWMFIGAGILGSIAAGYIYLRNRK